MRSSGVSSAIAKYSGFVALSWRRCRLSAAFWGALRAPGWVTFASFNRFWNLGSSTGIDSYHCGMWVLPNGWGSNPISENRGLVEGLEAEPPPFPCLYPLRGSRLTSPSPEGGILLHQRCSLTRKRWPPYMGRPPPFGLQHFCALFAMARKMGQNTRATPVVKGSTSQYRRTGSDCHTCWRMTGPTR